MRYWRGPRLSVCVVPLALGHISVDMGMAVLDGVELVVLLAVLDVAEMAVLAGVGVVVLDGVWLVVEELLFS